MSQTVQPMSESGHWLFVSLPQNTILAILVAFF